MAVITELYKGILLNRQGNEAPNGDIETAVLKTLIDRSEYITSIINAGNAGDIAMFTGNPAAALGPSAMNQVNNIVVSDFYDVLRLFTEETVDGFGIQISNTTTGQSDGTKVGVNAAGHAVLSSPNQILLDAADGIVNIRGILSQRTVARITNVSNYENIALGAETAFIEIGLDESNDEPHIRCKGYDSFYIEDYLTGVTLPKSWFHKSDYAGIRIGYDHEDTETTPVNILLDGDEINIVGTALKYNGNDVTLLTEESGSFTATWAGFSGTDPSCTVSYNRSGKMVRMHIGAFSGNALSTNIFTTSGTQPPSVRPSVDRVVNAIAWVSENGETSTPKNIMVVVSSFGGFGLYKGGVASGVWINTGVRDIGAIDILFSL